MQLRPLPGGPPEARLEHAGRHVAPDSGRTGRVADLPRDDADVERGHRPEQALKPPTHEAASVLEMLRVTSGIAHTHEDSASPAEFTLVMVTARAGRYGGSPGHPTGASLKDQRDRLISRGKGAKWTRLRPEPGPLSSR